MPACNKSSYFFRISCLNVQGHYPLCSQALVTFYLEDAQINEVFVLTLKGYHRDPEAHHPRNHLPPQVTGGEHLPLFIGLSHCFFFLLAGLSKTSILPLPPSACGSFMLSMVTSEGMQSSSSDSALFSDPSCELSSELSSSFESD